MGRILGRLLGTLVVFAIFVAAGYGFIWFSGEISGAKVAEEMLENFKNGAPVSFVSKYNTADGYEGVYTYKRDSKGNIVVIEDGVYLGEEYYFEDYIIDGDVYYLEDGELFTLEDDNGYFAGESDYLKTVLESNGIKLFDNDIDAEFKREGDYLVATGQYEGSTEVYTVKLHKKGTEFLLVDDEYDMVISFEYDELIQLP